MTLTEFLLARIDDDEQRARAAGHGNALVFHDDNAGWVQVELPDNVRPAYDVRHIKAWAPSRVLAECEAKRRIIELHTSWPVLVDTPPVVEFDAETFAARASQKLLWLTQQEYRDRFGDEPPTTPMLAAMAVVYADHPDYDEAWRP